jgi:hypothetical protein
MFALKKQFEMESSYLCGKYAYFETSGMRANCCLIY